MSSICSKESKLEVLVVPFSLIPVFLAPSPPILALTTYICTQTCCWNGGLMVPFWFKASGSECWDHCGVLSAKSLLGAAEPWMGSKTCYCSGGKLSSHQGEEPYLWQKHADTSSIGHFGPSAAVVYSLHSHPFLVSPCIRWLHLLYERQCNCIVLPNDTIKVFFFVDNKYKDNIKVLLASSDG